MLKLDNEFTAEEAQARFPELLDRAADGQEIRITRQGQPAMRLSASVEPASCFDFRREIIQRIRDLAQQAKPLGASVAELKAEGRR